MMEALQSQVIWSRLTIWIQETQLLLRLCLIQCRLRLLCLIWKRVLLIKLDTEHEISFMIKRTYLKEILSNIQTQLDLLLQSHQTPHSIYDKIPSSTEKLFTLNGTHLNLMAEHQSFHMILKLQTQQHLHQFQLLLVQHSGLILSHHLFQVDFIQLESDVQTKLIIQNTVIPLMCIQDKFQQVLD